MTTQATTDLGAVLIERVRKTAAVGIEKKTVTWGRIEKTDVEPAGTSTKPYRIPFTPEDNPSEQWASSEGFDYAPGNRQIHAEMTISYVRMSATCSFTKDVLQINEQNAATIFNTTLNEVKNKTVQLRKVFNQYSKGPGTGVLGTVSSVASSPTITFGTDVFGIWKLRHKNLRVQFWPSNFSAQRTGGGVTVSTVQSYDIANKTVTFDAVPSDAAGSDLVTVVGAANNVLRGTRYHLNNSGTYQNLSRATYPQLNSLVISASSTALSLAYLSQIYHTAVFRVQSATSSGMFNSDGFVWSFPPGQCQAYEQLGQVRQQINQNSAGNLDMGFTGMSHNGIPILEEVDQQDDEIELINFSKLTRFQLKELSPETFPGGGIYWPQNAGSGQGHADAVNVYLTWKGEIGCYDPKELGARGTSLATTGLASRHLA